MFCRQQGQPIYPHTICLLYITELNVPCFPIFIQNHASRIQASCNIILRSSKTTLTELYPLDCSLSQCYFIESRILQPEPFYRSCLEIPPFFYMRSQQVNCSDNTSTKLNTLHNFSHCEMRFKLDAIACRDFTTAHTSNVCFS